MVGTSTGADRLVVTVGAVVGARASIDSVGSGATPFVNRHPGTMLSFELTMRCGVPAIALGAALHLLGGGLLFVLRSLCRVPFCAAEVVCDNHGPLERPRVILFRGILRQDDVLMGREPIAAQRGDFVVGQILRWECH
jgi:hypothetical protein